MMMHPSVEDVVGGAAGGSPLYQVADGHAAGLAAVALVPVAIWLLRRRTDGLGAGYRALAANRRALVWLLMVTAAVHLGLVVDGHSPVLRVLFGLDAALLVEVTRRILLGLRWRRLAAVLLSGSLLAYAVVVVASEPPDQVGVATKLVEIAALALVLRPAKPTLVRRTLASAGTVALVVSMGLVAWIGAFAAAERGATDGHHGAVPMPGFLLRPGEAREPTRAERAAADRAHRQGLVALQRYHDVGAAKRDGYQVDRIIGNDYHAENTAYAADGRVFDLERPESLVYAETKRGPVLLGAVYQMPEVGQPGPRIGGPLTDWHAHENVCMSLVPLALSGFVSPYGGCAVGSVAIPVTPEEIHLWVVPGVPDPWGDMDEKWRARYLASYEAGA
jgi:hypothetical protein